jgi:hypothetical protein
MNNKLERVWQEAAVFSFNLGYYSGTCLGEGGAEENN